MVCSGARRVLSVAWCRVGFMRSVEEVADAAGVDAPVGEVSAGGRRFRGKNRQAAWKCDAGALVSVVRAISAYKGR